MKIKRILPCFAVFCVLTLLMTGCSASMKTAKVAAKFGTALKEQPITSATAEINCNVTTSALGVTAESRLHTVVKSIADWEVDRSYSDIITTVTALGSDLSETMQSYSSGESGQEVRYVHVDHPDTWIRLESQKRILDIDPSLVLMLLEKVAEDTTMEITENTAGGGVHYILAVTFDAEDIRAFAESADIRIAEEFADCDLSGVTIPVELEIEDKTFLPIRLSVRVNGINDSLLTALARSFARGKEIEGIEVNIDEISLLIRNFGYGPQDIPMLPKGAAENALDMKKVKEIRN